MVNDDFSGMELAGIPKIDCSSTANMASGIQAQFEESNKRTQKIAEEAYNNRQRMQKAVEQTAINTAETNVQLQKVIKNQNSYIDVLMDQLSSQKQQLELNEQQLTTLKNIFASGEDGIIAEKEIMKLIQNEIDSSHPVLDYAEDKGGDIAVAGITAVAPVIFKAIKMYLVSKGVLLP